MRHRSIADALQRGLLAAEPPMPSGLEVAGRCLPAAGHVIGGDWYDIIPLGSDRTGLVVGDVMGPGLSHPGPWRLYHRVSPGPGRPLVR
jgi:serine phosphatase RsbU (regulator of sigma subunit)